jgi:pyrimidine-nucleoside phosphorylase
MYDIIEKKKHGEALSEGEIRELIRLYTDGNIPDYQMSALLMAIYFNGMTKTETSNLTDAMATSGDTVDLSMFGDLSVDKHSTGGVGDKTTLIVTPIVAAAGAVAERTEAP